MLNHQQYHFPPTNPRVWCGHPKLPVLFRAPLAMPCHFPKQLDHSPVTLSRESRIWYCPTHPSKKKNDNADNAETVVAKGPDLDRENFQTLQNSKAHESWMKWLLELDVDWVFFFECSKLKDDHKTLSSWKTHAPLTGHVFLWVGLSSTWVFFIGCTFCSASQCQSLRCYATWKFKKESKFAGFELARQAMGKPYMVSTSSWWLNQPTVKKY